MTNGTFHAQRGFLNWWLHQRNGRRVLLALVVGSLVALQVLLIWFEIRNQNELLQHRTTEAASVVANRMQRILADDLQELQAITWQEQDPARWHTVAAGFLSTHKQLQRIERRWSDLSVSEAVDSPFYPALFQSLRRAQLQGETVEACRDSEATGIPTYSKSYFVPVGRGLGIEVIDLCIPERAPGKPPGFVVVVIGLSGLLEASMPVAVFKEFEVSFVLGDGTRLARAGESRGVSVRAERLMSVPGLTLQLRVESTTGLNRIEWNAVAVLGVILNGMLFVIFWLLARAVRNDRLARQQQERFQAAARLSTIGEMASLISHEINQPLLAVTMYADAAMHMSGDAKPAEVQDLLGRIAGEVARVSRVVKSVQTFVRRGEVVHETVSPRQLLESVMPLIEMHARKSGTVLKVEVAPSVEPVLCDRVMVEQVLLNLARNSIQAMELHKERQFRRLRIVVRPCSERRVKFVVSDTGPGIPSEVSEEIDKPFKKSKSDGMGLGLSLCRSVIEKHGGVLTHRSIPAPEGSPHSFAGAEFSFSLRRASGVSTDTTTQ